MNPFYKYNDKDYLKYTSPATMSIIKDVQKTSSDGPYITYDIAKFVYGELEGTKEVNDEIEIKKTIRYAISFFRKAQGREEEIYNDLLSLIDSINLKN